MKMELITDAIKQKLEKLVHLECLAIVRCGLKSLDNLPELSNLLRVNLDHNYLTGEEIPKLGVYSKIISISLIGNKVDNINDLRSFQ